MVNFNSLPDTKPNNVPDIGRYFATIKTAEMKKGKDLAKPPYLNMKLQLTKADGTGAGVIFDMLSESDSDTVRYKLKRFIVALGLPLTASFELKDLCKIIIDKKFIVDVTVDDRNPQYGAKGVVDVFKGEIYYPLSDAALLFDNLKTDPAPTINATDGDDTVPFSVDGDTEY